MDTSQSVSDAVRALFAEYPDILCGFADIGYSAFSPQYRSAIVFAVPYGKQLTPESYTEPDFEEGIQSARARLETIVPRLGALLEACGATHYAPPVAQENETELRAPFSFKYAATRAGIGWYGKQDVIITERSGPRVRLSAVLTDAPLEYGRPIDESRCPDDCRKCVDICPCKAVKGVRWDSTRCRADLIDYHRCNRMRSAFIPRLGRKSACGLCLAACPFGFSSAMRAYVGSRDEDPLGQK